MRDFKAFKEWIDISVGEESELDANFDTIAKAYAISVSSMIQDDYSDAVFFKSIRMAEVLKNIMSNFMKEKINAGFMYGELTNSIVPERVAIKGSKALKSTVVYISVIQ